MEESIFYVNTSGELCVSVVCYSAVEYTINTIVEDNGTYLFLINDN
jgi:hypothetical protein